MRLSSFVSACAGLSAAALIVGSPGCRTPPARAAQFDLVIANGRIVDGTGSPWFRGDIGIAGDRIAAIGALGDATAATRIDAQNIIHPTYNDAGGEGVPVSFGHRLMHTTDLSVISHLLQS